MVISAYETKLRICCGISISSNTFGYCWVMQQRLNIHYLLKNTSKYVLVFRKISLRSESQWQNWNLIQYLKYIISECSQPFYSFSFVWTIELATLTSLINKEVINGSQRVFERMKRNTLEAFQELTTRNTISWLVTAAMKLKDVCSLEEKL